MDELKQIAATLEGLDVSDATDVEMRIFKILEGLGLVYIEDIYDDKQYEYSVFSLTKED